MSYPIGMSIPHPITNAVRVLREQKVAFEPHLYPYEERGGTAVSSRELVCRSTR